MRSLDGENWKYVNQKNGFHNIKKKHTFLRRYRDMCAFLHKGCSKYPVLQRFIHSPPLRFAFHTSVHSCLCTTASGSELSAPAEYSLNRLSLTYFFYYYYFSPLAIGLSRIGAVSCSVYLPFFFLFFHGGIYENPICASKKKNTRMGIYKFI